MAEEVEVEEEEEEGEAHVEVEGCCCSEARAEEEADAGGWVPSACCSGCRSSSSRSTVGLFGPCTMMMPFPSPVPDAERERFMMLAKRGVSLTGWSVPSMEREVGRDMVCVVGLRVPGTHC